MAFVTTKRDLYGGELELIFNPAARNRYLINDKTKQATTYPVGVTTVLSKVLAKEALMMWPLNMARNYLTNLIGSELTEEVIAEACKQHTLRSDKGKDVGSEVHEAIEQFLRLAGMTSFPTSDAGVKAYNSFVTWFNSQDIKVLATEQIVYSRELKVAGTFDLFCEIGGKKILADIKTSNLSQSAPRGCYPEYLIQLGAYAEIYLEMNPDERIDDLLVINATKQGKLFTTYASDLGLSVGDCRNAFKAVLACYRFLEPLKTQLKELV